ncbi:CfrBI family restriction endonuclease [Flavobacteriaceae bacterium R38]|nr:CfrBI family restriction endonuclease [Flavobacteriaceae bacterium R38]
MAKKISNNIPELGLSLASYTGKQVITRIGDEIIKDVIISVFSGGNIRSLTEPLTRRRITLSSASLLITFLRSTKNVEGFPENMNELISKELTTNISKEKKIYLQWMLGLTGKSIQNVLRGNDSTSLASYLNDLDNTLKNTIDQAREDFGNIKSNFYLEKSDDNILLNWPSLLQLFIAIGTQTLAIRGSEKSMYGKLFEKLILGSLLRVLGFKLIDPNTSTESNMVFWLSQRGSKRESDATLLLKPGVGARFDIGFIGPGNTEISLDKVSRFEREMEHGSSLHFMSTIIIVDRIGAGSRITEMAEEIDGNIVQMSMAFWVKEIAKILNEKLGLDHAILDMSDAESINYIEKEVRKIDLNSFV